MNSKEKNIMVLKKASFIIIKQKNKAQQKKKRVVEEEEKNHHRYVVINFIFYVHVRTKSKRRNNWNHNFRQFFELIETKRKLTK